MGSQSLSWSEESTITHRIVSEGLTMPFISRPIHGFFWWIKPKMVTLQPRMIFKRRASRLVKGKGGTMTDSG